MKKINIVILLGIILSLFHFGCDITDSGKKKPIAFLEIYWNNQIYYSETLTEANNDTSKEIQLPDSSIIAVKQIAQEFESLPDEDTFWRFGSLITKQGFYSNCLIGSAQDTIRFHADTDFTPTVQDMSCGLVFNKNYGPIFSTELKVLNKADSSLITTITTDQHGRYAEDLTPGDYLIKYCEEIVEFNLENQYEDVEMYHVDMADKPNIYIYPEKETVMDVTIDFPNGGDITVSDPTYGKGWNNIKVSTKGIINGKHDFLSYESATSDFTKPQNGWVIEQNKLEEFFRRNLQKTGFKGREIEDFIEFWIPIFTDHKYYEIYPLYQKELDKKIVLNFSKKPDNILRLCYIVKGRKDTDLKLTAPQIPNFDRKGFVVTEWGVIRR